jgi:hypothetical protein
VVWITNQELKDKEDPAYGGVFLSGIEGLSQMTAERDFYHN